MKLRLIWESPQGEHWSYWSPEDIFTTRKEAEKRLQYLAQRDADEIVS